MARLVGLLDELASLRTRASSLRDVERTERDVEREIAAVRREVARVAPTRLPLLERVSIAAPCSVPWDAMTGDETARFCGQCQKHVYNIASMTAEDAETFLRGAGGEACLRIYRRADGTVLTADCAVGVRRRRRRRAVASVVGGGLVAAGALLAFEKTRPPAPVLAVPSLTALPEVDPIPLVPEPEVTATALPHGPTAGVPPGSPRRGGSTPSSPTCASCSISAPAPPTPPSAPAWRARSGRPVRSSSTSRRRPRPASARLRAYAQPANT